jgi:glycosyltransferase involved in cell wall biosynthesis
MPERILAYLSGAPRVSTRPEAEASGPRSHILGVMHAFQNLGWRVIPFIVGDQLSASWNRPGSLKRMSGNLLTQVAADLVRVWLGFWNALAASKAIRQADFVYERFAAFQALGRPFQKRGIPWVLETNGVFFHEAKNERQSMQLTSLARWLELRAYRDCDLLVCVSQPLRDLVVREAGIPAEKVLVLPNGVDVAFFDPERYAPLKFFSSPVIGYVGSFIRWQGLDLLLQAVAELRAEGLDYSLVLVGDGPARESLEMLTAQLGLTPFVRFCGQVSYPLVPAHIAGFDLGYSGQMAMEVGTMYHSPLKIYEYMAMARPVVASDYDDARAVIEPSKTGYLFEPGNLASLKETLRQAYRERPRWAAYGQAARETILSNHRWECRVQELIRQMERIAGHG